jgi:hypothetical protein
MEKRVFGIILTVLGIAGLVIAAVNFLNGSINGRDIKSILVFGLLGAVFFSAGIGLLRNTKDKAT